MMFIFAVALLLSTVSANPVKRFAGFNVAGIGGSAGCVVTGNKLYANGFFLRELTADEQRELAQYETNVKKYKEELKTSLEERREQWQARRSSKSSKAAAAPTGSTPKDTPKAPEKPSFCSAADTTQYYFDGCMVQNNKVYVGREYARDLSEDEIQELKEFDGKMSVYQKYLTSSIQQQVQGLFGSHNNFWQGLLGEETHTTTPAPIETSSVPPGPVEAPTAPNFCTAIY